MSIVREDFLVRQIYHFIKRLLKIDVEENEAETIDALAQSPDELAQSFYEATLVDLKMAQYVSDDFLYKILSEKLHHEGMMAASLVFLRSNRLELSKRLIRTIDSTKFRDKKFAELYNLVELELVKREIK